MQCTQVGVIHAHGILVDRELARFIYVREVKRLDPFKFSIYAWCIKIAIAGSVAPVRLAWVPYLGVPKNGFIYVEPILKNFMQDCSLMLWDHKFINASNFKLYVCGASNH